MSNANVLSQTTAPEPMETDEHAHPELATTFTPEPKIKISLTAINSIQTTTDIQNQIMYGNEDEDENEDENEDEDEDEDEDTTPVKRGRIILGTRVKSLRHLHSYGIRTTNSQFT